MKKVLLLFPILLVLTTSLFGQNDSLKYEKNKDFLTNEKNEREAIFLSFLSEERKKETLVIINGEKYDYAELQTSTFKDSVAQNIQSLYILDNLQNLVGCSETEKRFLVIINTNE